jgi:hypothetical protein
MRHDSGAKCNETFFDKVFHGIFPFKGTVQRKLTGVLSGINRKLMTCNCSDGHPFFNLKGLRSLKSKNVLSALTGPLF